MQNSLSLNELYKCYTEGQLKRKTFESAIFRIIRNNFHRYGLIGWNREDKDDYLSLLYLRIGNAIDNYRETGSNFETYMSVLVRLTAKEFRSRQARAYTEETTAWITQLPDMCVHEHEEEYCADTDEEAKNQAKPKNPRQLLILILKCCGDVDDDFLEKVAPMLGLEPSALYKMTDSLKELMERRKMEAVALREKINRQFLRCVVYEKKLQIETENTIVTERLKKQLEVGKKRLMKIRKRLARKNLAPSNAQIAKVLGISKSTVDSAMCSLRKRHRQKKRLVSVMGNG
jgi:DNA-directed RNA polymerase specialized sigma24 family protein